MYGRRDTQAATVYGLCDEFAPSLDHASPFDPMRARTSYERDATLVRAFVGAALAALVVWVASNTYWVDVKVPMP